jgi:2-dehydro-3-deoxygalactonokinase
MSDILACDWGTTRLRAWRLDAEGRVLCSARLELGVSRLQAGEAPERFEREVRPAADGAGLPAVLCGMIGSELGWRPIPHLGRPAGLDELAAGLQQVAPQVWIVPGLRCEGAAGAPDLMRGEETQVIGWLEAAPGRRRGRRLVCHPGTHAKWIVVEDGRMVRFRTVMTGELFELLRRHSILRSDARPDDLAAFDLGVDSAADGGLLSARLFTARTRVAAGQLPARSASAYLSGLLIGAEVAAMPQELAADPAEPLAVIGDLELGRLYQRALQRLGRRSELYDGELAAQRGLLALFRRRPA